MTGIYTNNILEEYKKSFEYHNSIYQYAIASDKHMNRICKYQLEDTEIEISMISIQILIHIYYNRGCNQAHLVLYWNKSKSYISNIIKDLMSVDLIYDEETNNKKNKSLYCSEKGESICIQHIQNGIDEEKQILSDLKRRGATQKEIENFFKILPIFINIEKNSKFF